MSVFGIFISPQEFKYNQLMKDKPKELLYTNKTQIKNDFISDIVHDEELNKDVIVATDSEKIALLHLLEPFFSFTFSDNEYGAIIIGEYHNLLKLDKEHSYIYNIDSSKFYPVVDKKGDFRNKWYSLEDAQITSVEPRKIKFNDVLSAGIQIFWINSMETLKQIDDEMNDQNIKTGEEKLEYLINQTNWKSDKVVYMNRYNDICPIYEKDGKYVIRKRNNSKNKKINDDE